MRIWVPAREREVIFLAWGAALATRAASIRGGRGTGGVEGPKGRQPIAILSEFSAPSHMSVLAALQAFHNSDHILEMVSAFWRRILLASVGRRPKGSPAWSVVRPDRRRMRVVAGIAGPCGAYAFGRTDLPPSDAVAISVIRPMPMQMPMARPALSDDLAIGTER